MGAAPGVRALHPSRFFVAASRLTTTKRMASLALFQFLRLAIPSPTHMRQRSALTLGIAALLLVAVGAQVPLSS